MLGCSAEEPALRKLVSSRSPYEPKLGISRAVRAGSFVTVSGTAPLGPDGRTVARGDAANAVVDDEGDR